MSHWRRTARSIIVKALQEGRAQGLAGKPLEKFVSERYPWGERRMHPYKIWLNEFALLVRGERKLMAASKKKASPKLIGEWPGLGSLFGKDEPL